MPQWRKCYVWSDQIVKIAQVSGPSLYMRVPGGALILGPGSLTVQGEAFVQDLPRFCDFGALEKLQDSSAGRQIDDRRVDVRVVEAPELEEDTVDPSQISEVGLGFAEELDRVIVATPELQSPAVTAVVGAFAVRLNHEPSPVP